MSEPCELCGDETDEQVVVTIGGMPVGPPMAVCEGFQEENESESAGETVVGP